MKENITRSESYTIGYPYTIRHVSSDFLNMSCYGYHFRNWKSVDGELSGGQVCRFAIPTYNVSAQWDRNIYDVRFFQIDGHTPINDALSVQNIEYKGEPISPIAPYVSERWKFRSWENFGPITSDTSCIANYDERVALVFLFKSDNSEISTLWYDKDTEEYSFIALQDIDKEKHNRNKYTFLGFEPSSPEEVGILSDSKNVKVVDVKNTISISGLGEDDKVQTNFKYTKTEHSLSIGNEYIIFNPINPSSYLVQYAGEDKVYSSNPPVIQDPGSILTWYKITSDDFFECEGSVYIRIAEKEKVNLSCFIRNYDDTPTVRVYNPFYGDDCIPEDAPNTISTDFMGWEDESVFYDIRENVQTSAKYKIRDVKVSYYNDSYAEEPYSLVKTDNLKYGWITTPPNIRRDGWKWDGWSYKQNEKIPAEDDLEKPITSDISVYGWQSKIVNLSIHQVYGGHDNIVWTSPYSSILSGEMRDEEFISSKVVTPENYRFDRFNPEMWNPINDDLQISVIYVPLRGTLTYHSHYPTI